MSFYASRALGRYGSGMMGAFGGGAGPELFSGGPAFIGGDDSPVFFGTNTGFTAGAKNQGFTWVPATTNLADAAANTWALLQQSADPNDQAFFQATGQKLATLLNSFYTNVGTKMRTALGIETGYNPDTTQRIIQYGNQLKAVLAQLANYKVAPLPLPAQLPPATNPSVNPVNYPSTTSGAQIATGAGITVMGSSGAAVGDAGDNTLLYVGLGVGAVALIGGMLYWRKKRSSTAGYRRRKRK